MESDEIWMTVLQLETYGNCVERNSKSEPYSSLLTPLPMLNFFLDFVYINQMLKKFAL